MAVGIGEVEVAFAPGGVAGCELRLQARIQSAAVEAVDVGDVEDDPPPERGRGRSIAQGQVEVVVAEAKRGKAGFAAAVSF